MNNCKNNFNKDEHQLNYRREIEKVKKLFLNKKIIIVLIIIFFLVLLSMSEKYISLITKETNNALYANKENLEENLNTNEDNGAYDNSDFIKKSLLNLNIPSELDDSCESDNCDGFSFYKGLFNDIDSRDHSRDYASIYISIEDYKTGYLLNNGKREKIVVVPYVWQWASTGINLYVLKIDNDSLIPLSRIPVGKGMPQNLKIEDNKIFFSYINLDDSIISRECYFKDNIIKESNLICS